MTAEELYYEFHLLVNKNNSQQNINVEKPHFIQLYNREYDRWLYKTLSDKNRNDRINDLQELLVPDKELEVLEVKELYNSYKLPTDFFYYSEVRVRAKKQDKEKTLFVYNIHPKEVNVYLHDEFSSPTFEWEESFSTISESTVKVYKKDFEIDKMYFSYYKDGQKLELAGYIKLDGSMSQNKDIVLSSVYLRQILDNVVKEYMRESENQLGFQLSQERIN